MDPIIIEGQLFVCFAHGTQAAEVKWHDRDAEGKEPIDVVFREVLNWKLLSYMTYDGSASARMLRITIEELPEEATAPE